MRTALVREALRKQPFRPFSLRLVDGREIPVVHPEYVAVSRHQVIVIGQDESSSWLDPFVIVSIEYVRNGSKRRKTTE